MSNLIQDSIRDGSLVLYHDYRAGHALDLSGNGNDGTLSTTCGLNAHGVKFFGAADQVSIADASELRLTAGSIIVVSTCGFVRKATANEPIIHKRSGGSSNYYFYLTPTGPTLFDGGVVSTIALTVIGRKGVGCSFTNGAVPVGYVDGLLAGNFNFAINVTPNNVALAVGNYFGSGRLRSCISSILLFNRILTATEHRQAYLELLK